MGARKVRQGTPVRVRTARLGRQALAVPLAREVLLGRTVRKAWRVRKFLQVRKPREVKAAAERVKI
jgi:hypothetical protein